MSYENLSFDLCENNVAIILVQLFDCIKNNNSRRAKRIIWKKFYILNDGGHNYFKSKQMEQMIDPYVQGSGLRFRVVHSLLNGVPDLWYPSRKSLPLSIPQFSDGVRDPNPFWGRISPSLFPE